MPLTNSEKAQLLAELRHLQQEVPEVQVRVDLGAAAVAAAQDRVDEIETILASGLVKRTAPADLEA